VGQHEEKGLNPRRRIPSDGTAFLGATYFQDAPLGRIRISTPWAPWTQNLYSYVGNNPVNMTDPTGHCPWCLIGAAGGAVVGGLYGAYRSSHSEGGFSWKAVGAYAVGGALIGVSGGALAAEAAVVIGGAAISVGAGSTGAALTTAGLSGMGATAAIEATVEEKSNPLQGTTYTPKVEQDMANDSNHGFPALIDEQAGYGQAAPLTGGDGVQRTLITLWGSKNGDDGAYQWIIEPNGNVNHRLFETHPIQPDPFE
jgi:hypothetical protein